ncbi:unnamed protein product [Bursaphelenchus xylophilus]|uniref:(pine wood nematode) hypothetical protein n=1 Tax=Bursaphelenchus xylophilus TaxID=6326 RepID=A0A1I7RHJ4_BURXY|nr:unnamed protein product [Bursaphelenchus xylophilus]CAG9115686.1 unnamed protein product [Bursaphelenchus xylophilus]
MFVSSSQILSNSCTPSHAAGAGASGSSNGNCCPPLTQTNVTDTSFGNGDLTFVYDNNACPETVTATCAIPAQAGGANLGTAIVANGQNFLATATGTSVSFPGTCNGNGQWLMGEPPITIETLECRLTNA